VLVDEGGRETPAVPNELPGAVPVQASDQPLPVEPAVPVDTPTQQPAGDVPPDPAPETAPYPVPEATPEQLQAQIATLEARLVEKDNFIGRQSGEVGELRQSIVELKTAFDAAQAQPATPTQAPTVVITQDLIDNSPGVATQAALDQGNEALLPIAFQEWEEQDPVSAKVWLLTEQAKQRDAARAAEFEALKAELAEVKEPLTQQAAKSADQAAWTEAFAEMSKSYPDFIPNAERILTDVAPQFPAIARLIADGDSDAKVQGLTLLYEKSKLGDPEATRAELEQAAAAAAAEAAAATAGAAAVTGQTTAGQSGVVAQTVEEAERQKYHDRREGRASLTKGWTGR
jgi:hypothetical protein